MNKKIEKFKDFNIDKKCNLSDDIILIKNDIGEYEEVKEPIDIIQITGILTDEDEIKKLSEGITVDTSITIKDAKIGQIIWLTCLLDRSNHKTFNTQKLGVIQCRIQNVYLGINKLNSIKR
jgi:hypothetical protein